MAIRNADGPTPTPASLHQTVHEGLVRLTVSRFGDARALTSVAQALDRWVSEYPDQAQSVERLALSASYTALSHGAYEAARQLGHPGLDASLLRPKRDSADLAAAMLLDLLCAEACLGLGLSGEAQLLLDEAARFPGHGDGVGPLSPYLGQRLELVRASSMEEALDAAAAEPRYRASMDRGEALLRNREHQHSLARHWVPLVFGDLDQVLQDGSAQATALLQNEVANMYRRAALGLGRTSADPVDGARRAVKACLDFGLPESLYCLELRPALLALPSAELSACAPDLLDKVAQMQSERSQAAWRTVVRLAHARALTHEDGPDAFLQAKHEVMKDLAQAADAMALAGAFADMLIKTGSDRGLAHVFLSAYSRIASGTPVAPLSLPLRVQFDEAISTIGAEAFDALDKEQSASTRRTLSLLIDALRAPEADELEFALPDAAANDAMPAELVDAFTGALDRLGRVHYAIARRPASCAVIMQTVGEEVLFTVATGEAGEALLLERTGAQYQRAACRLAQGLRDAIQDPALDISERIAHLGRAAFNALPAGLRSVLRRRKHIHLVPDMWADREGIPFELFHDGTDFLCLRKGIVRALSLRELVRSVEPQVACARPVRRALCVAVPEAGGLSRLQFAEDEVAAVRESLAGSGWSAPATGATRLDPQRLLDAMELARVTHLAAHGEVHAGGEALLLNDGLSLGVQDIDERERLFGGLVYLNACSLGRMRYLGAGMTRSIASALIRHGAPCVIANLLPVADRSARDFAAAFYAAARRRGAGDALRAARASMARNGVPPSRWGTTILLGDPGFRVFARPRRSEPPTETAAGLLYRYSVPGDEHEDAIGLSGILSTADGDRDDHVRLDAALKWVRGVSLIDDQTPGEYLRAAAQVAHALDNRPGEAVLRFMAAKVEDDDDARRTALDAAIRALRPLASLDERWENLSREALASRQLLDARREIPFIDGPVKVNDPDDPAVQMVLQIQHATDRQQIQQQGPLRLRRPERTLADLAWNAIVIGQQNRFQGPDAQAGFADQMARKLVALGLIDAGATNHLTRILAGCLPFFWESQRITHLVPELAQGQSETLLRMMEHSRDPHDPDLAALLGPVLEAVDALGHDGASTGNRFDRVLALLDAGVASSPTADLAAIVREAVEKCEAISAHTKSRAAAWCLGLLMERAYAARRAQPPLHGVRERLLQVLRELRGSEEGWFYPYLMDGFQCVREAPIDFVQHWKWNTRGVA